MIEVWVSMIDDVAQVYGMRPSLRNRNKLLKSVLNQLVMVGASHLLLDSSMEDFGTFSLAEKVSARLGQGLGAGIYTGKIGTAAIIAARPIQFTSGKQPRLQSVVGELVDELRRRFRQERER